MSPTELAPLIELMKANCLTSLSLSGVSLVMDPRGFATPAVQTTTVPPNAPPLKDHPLFKEMTDEELLTAHLAPEGTKE